MGADNWTYCFQCASNKAELSKASEVRALYGQIPAEEYEERLRVAKEEDERPLQETLREDYDLGMDGEDFQISYSGECTVCGFLCQYYYSFDFLDGKQKGPSLNVRWQKKGYSLEEYLATANHLIKTEGVLPQLPKGGTAESRPTQDGLDDGEGRSRP